MPNGEQFQLGKMIGELQAEVRQGFLRLDEKVDNITMVTDRHEAILRDHSKKLEKWNGEKTGQKSLVWYVVSGFAILSAIIMVVAKFIR